MRSDSVSDASCPVCLSVEVVPKRETYRRGGTEYRYRRCRDCQLEFVVPMVSADAEHYGDREWYGERWEYRSSLAVTNMNRGRILEVGCGEGHFAEIAAHRHNRVVGVDFNAAALERARERAPEQTFAWVDIKQIAGAVKAHAPFDMVAAFHVIEHLENVREFVSECVSMLRPGGFLVVATPSTRRPTAILGLHEWWDTPPHHLTRWNEPSFAALAKHGDLKLCRIVYQDLDEMQLRQAVRNKIYKSLFSYFGNRTILYAITKLLSAPVYGVLRVVQGRRNIFSGKSVLVVARKRP